MVETKLQATIILIILGYESPRLAYIFTPRPTPHRTRTDRTP